MIKKLLLFIAITVTIINNSHSQSCGTHIPADFFKQAKLRSFAVGAKSIQPHTSLPNVNLSISVYITGTNLKSGELEEAIDSLNSAFKPIGISFSTCTVTMLEENEFSAINNAINEERLTSLHSTINTINLYFADKLLNDGEEVCGYAYLPVIPSWDYIFIERGCNINTTLIHEMGHYFGLLHPHETKGGYEMVDESNCNVAGDLICDTKASPNLIGLVNNNCEYTGNYRDSNGEFYVPTVSNHMSYSSDNCRCKFTQEQYKRMVDFYWSHRTHLH